MTAKKRRLVSIKIQTVICEKFRRIAEMMGVSENTLFEHIVRRWLDERGVNV